MTQLPGTPGAYSASGSLDWNNNLAITPSGSFLYSPYDDNSSGQGGVAAFAVDSSGNLTPVPGSPFAAGNTPVQAAIDPAGKFLYVQNAGTISVFAINSSTGALTEVAGSPFSSWGDHSLVLHPSGKFLYSVNFAGRVVVGLSIDTTTGALTPIPGSPFGPTVSGQPATFLLESGVMHPAGFLFVIDADGEIYSFTVDPNTGALTETGVTAPAGGFLTGTLAVDPSGKFLYASGTNASNLLSFQINQTDGTLTPIGSPNPGFQNIGIGTLGLTALRLP